MSAIDDLIAQIEDARLRDRLRSEWEVMARTKKFGLVYEEHLPELLPVFGRNPRVGDLVARKSRSLNAHWRVSAISGDEAQCVQPDSTGPTTTQVSFALNELVVLRQFGEPIFPALRKIDAIKNGDQDAVWHTLIEADNYHALQLLEYVSPGGMDCIYIDPPYNTGAKDWKYNNDYVDKNDVWRHSKWVSFMSRRLRLAKRLLKKDSGVLVVTIDEHEVHHLRMILEEIFPRYSIQMITAVTNPKGVTQGGFSRVEEYIIYCFPPGAKLSPGEDDLLTANGTGSKAPRWKGLLRSGSEARRVDRQDMFYPVWIEKASGRIAEVGEPLPLGKDPTLGEEKDGLVAAWPVRSDKSLGRWGVGRNTLRELVELGYASAGRYDAKRKTYGINYLSQQLRAQINSGQLLVTGRDPTTGVAEVVYAEAAARKIKTVWHRTRHDAGAHGSDLVRSILNSATSFAYPKSIYATLDAIAAVVRDNPSATVLDFFAGSGTTLNAVNLLNAVDGGQRRCILVTNNEVSQEDADALTELSVQRGDEQWEERGICRAVTWPRSKFTIAGERDDGSALPGEYLTGRTRVEAANRRYVHVGFVASAELSTQAKRRQLTALLDGIPVQSVRSPRDQPFIVSGDLGTSVLFDTSQSKEWLAALEGADHIDTIYVVTPSKSEFDDLKAAAEAILQPLESEAPERRPVSQGFAANLAYFKLDFLEKDQVSLNRALRELLPILWMLSGSAGEPDFDLGEEEPDMFFSGNFGVLIREASFPRFVSAALERSLRFAFIVTDDDEAFHEMYGELVDHLGFQGLEARQLYRDYLDNFMINRELRARVRLGGFR